MLFILVHAALNVGGGGGFGGCGRFGVAQGCALARYLVGDREHLYYTSRAIAWDRNLVLPSE